MGAAEGKPIGVKLVVVEVTVTPVVVTVVNVDVVSVVTTLFNLDFPPQAQWHFSGIGGQEPLVAQTPFTQSNTKPGQEEKIRD